MSGQRRAVCLKHEALAACALLIVLVAPAHAQQGAVGATAVPKPGLTQAVPPEPMSSTTMSETTSAQPGTTAAQPIDLATALRLAGLKNLDLAIVQQAERLAKAENDAATLQFFPWLSIGETYRHYTGADQQTPGNMIEVDRRTYRRGATVGAELDFGKAIFQKLAARQLQSAAEQNVQAQNNSALLAAASAYFDLANSVAEMAIARDAVRISRSYEEELHRAVAIGVTNESEALRVSVQTQKDEVLFRQAEATERSDSAALSTVLRLDPAIELIPTERIVVPPTLVPLDTPLGTLLRQALVSRPEVHASEATVIAAERQRTAAKYGPLIPSISAEAIYGQARGSPTATLMGYQPAHDYVVGLDWRLGPGGLFDFSRTEVADANLDTQRLRELKVRQQISRQVVDALSAARSADDQMLLARHGVELANRSLELSTHRKQFGVYAVLEVIQAQQDLTRARSDYASSLAAYAKAQYALALAIGRIGP